MGLKCHVLTLEFINSSPKQDLLVVITHKIDVKLIYSH